MNYIHSCFVGKIFVYFLNSSFCILLAIFKESALWDDSFFKSKCLSVCLTVCLLVCSLLMYRVNVFFAPTFCSRMSKNFRASESLVKSNGKKHSEIGKLLLINGVKSPHKKRFVFGQILPYWAGFVGYRCYYPYRSRDSLSPVCEIFCHGQDPKDRP